MIILGRLFRRHTQAGTHRHKIIENETKKKEYFSSSLISYNWIINIIFSTLSIETRTRCWRRRKKELSSFSVGLNIIHASWKLKHNLLSFRPFK